jgi:hypothetical protein
MLVPTRCNYLACTLVPGSTHHPINTRQEGSVEVRVSQAPSAKQVPSIRSKCTSGAHDLDKASDPALTGTTVWDGAVVLSHLLADTALLEEHRSAWDAAPATMEPSPVPVRCLELGAGTGLVSISLLATGRVAHATVTDLPDLLPHLRSNLQRNAAALPCHAAEVRALRWGPEGEGDLTALGEPARTPRATRSASSPSGFHLIVGSDLIYYTYW